MRYASIIQKHVQNMADTAGTTLLSTISGTATTTERHSASASHKRDTRSRRQIFIMTANHSSPQNIVQSHGVCPFPQNFHILAKFCRIWYRPVKRAQIWHNFGWVQAAVEYGHNGTVKYTTATPARTEGILKILNLFQILPVYLVDRLQICQLWLLLTNIAYLVKFRRP